MLIALALTSALVHAEEAKFEGVKAPEEAPKPEVAMTANVGGTFAAGNSESIAFNAGADFRYKWKRNQLGLVGGLALGSGAVDVDANGFLDDTERCIGATGKDCQATTEKYNLDLRYDRFFSKTTSLYLLVGGLHDKFGGFDLRAHAQLGVANNVIDREKTKLKVEIGADFANEDFVDGITPNSQFLIALQAGAAYSHAFNDNVSFTDGLSVYVPLVTQPTGEAFAPSLADVRVANTAGITAKMTDKLSISVTDTLGWRNQPVAPPDGFGVDANDDGHISFEEGGRSSIDNTLSVALVASLL